LEAATICIALVICAVFFTERILRRMSRVLAIDQSLGGGLTGDKVTQSTFQFGRNGIIHCFFLTDGR
jgi:hypothetical protein